MSEGSSPSRLPELSRWPAVSVVVPARDCAGTLPAAVRSALEQRFDGSLEVVIAVGPSADETERVAAELSHDHPNVRYQPNPSGTTAAALNRGVQAARGDVIVRLDAHAELPPGYIARALDLLRETGAGNVGGMQEPVGGDRFGRAVAAAMASPVGSGGARYRMGGLPGEVDTVYLGVFHAAALDAVGGFDESLLRNQDYELNHRLRESGFPVYFHPDLRVRYRPRGSPGQLWRQYYDYGTWKRHVIRRNPRSLRARQLAAPTLVLALVAAVVVSAVVSSPWPLVAVVGAYLALIVAGGLAAAERPAQAPLVTIALATMHLAWGLGFLFGSRWGLRPAAPPRGRSEG